MGNETQTIQDQEHIELSEPKEVTEVKSKKKEKTEKVIKKGNGDPLPKNDQSKNEVLLDKFQKKKERLEDELEETNIIIKALNKQTTLEEFK